MSDPSLLLYEAGQRWSGLLRRTLQPQGVRVVQEGSLAACARRLLAGEMRLAAIEVQAAQLSSVLELAVRASRFAAPAGIIVLADRELAGWEGDMLEAGLLHCEFSPRKFERLGEMIPRWLAEYASGKLAVETNAETEWPAALGEVMAGWNTEFA